MWAFIFFSFYSIFLYTFINKIQFYVNCSDSETKIALEIRELKEREAELRAIREMREREQQLRNVRNGLQVPDEDEERASSSSRETADDHLASLTTTTDEGNYSEYGDPTSSEDKSSDGSNRLVRRKISFQIIISKIKLLP